MHCLERRALPVLASIGLALASCAKPVVPPAGMSPSQAAAVGTDRAQATLERGAQDLDVAIRQRALALLILSTPAPAGGPWGPRALWDPNPWVQKRGVEALATRVSEPETRALLASLATRSTADPYARGSAAMRLALHGDHTILPALQEAYRAEAVAWRAAPLALAAATMGDTEALTKVDATLRQGELPLELGFVADIGRSRLQALVPALVESAEQVEEPLVLPLAASLVELGSPHGESLFREALSSSDAERRLEALDFLVELRSPAAAVLLRRAAHGAAPDLVEKYSSYAMLVHGEGSVALAAHAVAQDPDREARALAVRCLGIALEAGSALPLRDQKVAHRAIVQALADPEDMVLTEAVKALARTGDAEDVAIIASLLDAEALALRVEAAGAVLVIGNHGS